jgi:glycosyltransferase involved in cell wall biosynthesis
MQDIMKVKMLGPALFLPENANGVNKTTYNLLKNHQGLEVEFYYPAETLNTPVLPAGFEHVTLRPIVGMKLRKINGATKLASLLSPRPFISETKKNLRLLAEQINTGPLVVMSLTCAGIIEFLSGQERSRTILIPIDCLSYFYESRIQNEASWLKRWLYRFDAWKARRFESGLYQSVRKSLFVSPYDASFAAKISGGDCLGIPYGVDLKKFDDEVQEGLSTESNARDLIFTGNFDYGPNIAGALFLTDQVMPLLRKRNLGVRLILAGGNPVHDIKERAAADIIVTGFVDSLTPLIRSSKIFLSPIFFGAGVKTKVLEAMYLESIVLGTPESFYAIEAQVGVDVLSVEDRFNPEAWAREIIKILEHPNDYQGVGARAKQAILSHHQWSHVRELYHAEFEKLAT